MYPFNYIIAFSFTLLCNEIDYGTISMCFHIYKDTEAQSGEIVDVLFLYMNKCLETTEPGKRKDTIPDYKLNFPTDQWWHFHYQSDETCKKPCIHPTHSSLGKSMTF